MRQKNFAGWNVISYVCVSTAMVFTNSVVQSSEFFVEEVKTISCTPFYHGWSTLTRSNSGELLLVFSGGREAHICPFGRVEMMRSSDNGQHWSWPQVLLDGPIDDRDAGVCVTETGTILVTTFSSLAYEGILEKAARLPQETQEAWPSSKLFSWNAVHARISDERRTKELGVWMIRSENGGTDWSGRYRVPVNSPHGPVCLSDGSLLYAGVALWSEERRVGVCRSTDDGQSWQWLADMPVRPGDSSLHYHELHAVEASDGRLVVQLRNHNATNKSETLQSESIDRGHTWSQPHSIDVWGLPSHLVRLRDDRLLMTYGHRRSPFGIQARLSNDCGKTWSDPMILYGDGASGDLGYPSTVQLDGKMMVTVWYELPRKSSHAVLRQARWTLSQKE